MSYFVLVILSTMRITFKQFEVRFAFWKNGSAQDDLDVNSDAKHGGYKIN